MQERASMPAQLLGADADELDEPPGCAAFVTALVTGAVAEETAPVTELTVPPTPETSDDGPEAEALAVAIRHTTNAIMIAVTPKTDRRPNQRIGQTVPRAYKTNQLCVRIWSKGARELSPQAAFGMFGTPVLLNNQPATRRRTAFRRLSILIDCRRNEGGAPTPMRLFYLNSEKLSTQGIRDGREPVSSSARRAAGNRLRER